MPEPHEPRELFARRGCLLAGTNELCVGLGGEYFAACLVELIDCAGLLEMAGKLGGSLRIRLCLAERSPDLA